MVTKLQKQHNIFKCSVHVNHVLIIYCLPCREYELLDLLVFLTLYYLNC